MSLERRRIAEQEKAILKSYYSLGRGRGATFALVDRLRERDSIAIACQALWAVARSSYYHYRRCQATRSGSSFERT